MQTTALVIPVTAPAPLADHGSLRGQPEPERFPIQPILVRGKSAAPSRMRVLARLSCRWQLLAGGARSVIANVGIVITGGAVRLTGSGLGCPTWPRCTEDSYAPPPRWGPRGHRVRQPAAHLSWRPHRGARVRRCPGGSDRADRG